MNYKNILVIKLSAIGDVIHTLPAVHALRQNNPNARITWIVEKPSYDLLTNNPDIDEIIVFEKPKFKTWSGLWKHAPEFSRLLKAHRFDLAIDFQGLFKSAAISLLSSASKRVGYCNMREMSQWVSQPVCGIHRDGHVIDRYLDVVRGLGGQVDEVQFPVHITDEEAAQAKKIACDAGLNLGEPYAVLAPGTNWPTKCWPAERFAELADKLQADGVRSVVVGGPGDQALAEEIQSNCQASPVDVTGRTSLKQLSYLTKKSAVFVGGDTGPMHLAVAVGTPVVALFGPTDPARNGPYQGRKCIIRPARPCLNCWKRKCEQVCLGTIEVTTVLDAVKSLLNPHDVFAAAVTDNGGCYGQA
jgi:heptosyltransferase-1